MNRKHLVFIINPCAGVRRNKLIQDAVEAGLDRNQYSYDLQYTQYAKHGIELAAAAAKEGAYAVVAVGGDGSVNDIVNGLQGSSTALAIIPAGSGNGMARTLKIPKNIHQAIAIINRNNTAMMDIAYANDRLFVSNAGVGFEALISEKFTHSRRRGLAVYSWLVVKHLWQYQPLEWQIEIDGKKITECAFIVTVANGQQFGYNFHIAPTADWQDGLLDLVIVKKFPLALGVPIAIRSLNGTLLQSPYVRHFRGKEITISHPKLKLVQTDGDAHECTSSIHFKIVPHAQKIFV